MTDAVLGAAFIVSAYFIGAIPTAHLVALRAGRDIRRMGSGNVGALNAYRSFGKRAAAAVLSADVAKGALVMAAGYGLDLPGWSMYAGAVAAMVGHNFPVYIGFRGGKGAAVVAGISLAVLPVLTLLTVPALVLGYAVFRTPFWALFFAFVALNTLTIATGQPLAQILLCLGLTLMVGSTHLMRAFRFLWPAIKTLDFHRIGQIE